MKTRTGCSPPAFRDLVILLLPDLTVLADAADARLTRVPVTSKVIALLGIGYVVSPTRSDSGSLLVGPIGLLDDLLIVSATLVESAQPRPSRRGALPLVGAGRRPGCNPTRYARWSASILFGKASAQCCVDGI